MRQTNYKSMDFLSTTFWHFVRDWVDDKGAVKTHALNVLLEKILDDEGAGILKKDPTMTGFHHRTVTPERVDSMVSKSVSDDSGEVIEFALKEPKAVCFADIPFNFLPIHLRAYNGIGLGFSKDELYSHPDFRPVTYYPRVTGINLKDACEELDDEKLTGILKPYSKIESSAEPFSNIYREREWRVLSDISFNFQYLSCIIFRTNAELLTAIGDDKIRKLMNKGVSMLSCDRHFDAEKK